MRDTEKERIEGIAEFYLHRSPEGSDLHTLCKIAQAYLNPWISVEERLPEPGSIVDIYSESSGRETNIKYWGMSIRGGEWINQDEYWLDYVTHWMPLPNPPKE